jgi:hypothetical protein
VPARSQREFGRSVQLEVEPTRRLIDVLRDDLGLAGTKEGCSIGVCGACTVLVNGQVLSACLTLAVTLSGRSGATSATCCGHRTDVRVSRVKSARITEHRAAISTDRERGRRASAELAPIASTGVLTPSQSGAAHAAA